MFNNKTKTFLLLTLVFITIIGVSAVTAADVDNDAADTPLIAEDTTSQADTAGDNSVQNIVSNKNTQITKTTTENVKGNDETANFTSLETDIAGSAVTLSKDYVQGEGESNITITSDKVIDGAGHTIVSNAGMFIIENGVTLTVNNLIVNSTHGPTYSNYWYDFYDKGSLILNNVTFNYIGLNRTYGGQIYVDANANLTVTDSLFNGEDNVRSQIYANGNDYTINIDKSTFTNYNTQYSAIDLNKRGNLTVTNSNFINNIMGDNGGAIYVNTKDCVVLVENCIFENLTAKYRGGGICANYGYVTVKDSTFRNLVQNATSNNAGAIFVGYNTGSLDLKNNVMENNTANAADIYFAAGNCTSDINVAGEDITADQESPVTLTLNVTDDNGNTVDFRTSPFTIKINDETITTKYANGTITATFDASYEPGEYDINITYNDAKLLGNVAIPNIKLTVKDIGLLSYVNVTEKIAAARAGATINIEGPVFRKANEESILITKNGVKINFHGNTINAKGEKVFEIADGINEVTIIDATITNIGNSNPTLDNTQGRFIIANNTHVILDEVVFLDNIATDMSSAPGSFIFAVDSILEVEDCYVSNSTGTFINNVNSDVYITESVFENNNLYKSSSANWNALICDGGYLEVRDSVFANNTPNFAVIDGQSQILSMFEYGSSLLFNNQEMIIDNCLFIDNYARNGKGGAIHTYNDTTVTNSLFINNKIGSSSNYGGAISSEDGALTVDRCAFVNNSARYSVSSYSGTVSGNDGTAIYNKAGDLSIKNSMIISNITEFAAVYNAASGVSIDINGNYWGNETPEGFIKSTSSGDVMTIDDWAVLNVTVEPSENIKYHDNITVKAFFSKNTDGSQITTFHDYDAATFTASGGILSEKTVDVKNNEAKTTFNVGYNPFIITASYPNMEAEYYGEAIMPQPQTIVLNDGNWTEYFNDDGTLVDTIIPDSELQFEGEFTDRFMIINIPVNITTAPTQAVLNNCSFLVVSDYVTISKLQINNTDMEDAPIIVEDSSEVLIESNTISVTNNEDKMETRAIVIDGGAYNVIRNNTITTVGPEDNLIYNSDYSINTIYTTSIDADSDYLLIDSNKITTRKNDKESELSGTIFGIYIHGSNSENPVEYPYIFDNEIVTEGDVYVYGLKMHYANNAYINSNTVTGTSNLYTSGIHVFVISDSKIVKNVVNSKASDITYGIVLEGAMDYVTYAVISTENTVVSDNVVDVESDLAWAIETYAGIENYINHNNITVNANNGLGIGLTDQDSTVSYNNIHVYSKDTSAKAASYDYIDPYTTGIKIANNGLQLVRDNEVSFNNITVVADKDEIPGVNSSTNYNTITDNFIVSPRGLGDEGVVDTGRYGTVEDNLPASTVLTDDSYSEFFDEGCSLKPEFNNANIKVSGEFKDNTVFIFDAVNVTLTSDGTVVLYDGQIMTGNNASVIIDGFVFNNTMDAFVLESSGNTIKNTVINIDSDDEIHAIYVYDDNNTISNTTLNIVAPSANVIYNPDYSVKTPAPAAIVISSSNNVIEDVEIYFDGREAIHDPSSSWDAPTVDGIYLVSSTTPIENNTITDTSIEVLGCSYAYGINVGNAKNTNIKDIYVDVECDFYADAIQLFDADTISITGKANAASEGIAYGVYSTAMGTGFSKNIDLTGLDINVVSAQATGVLIEGSSNITIADAEYEIVGAETTAINAKKDFMQNIPSNIIIDNMDISLTGTEDNNVLYFEEADTVSITNSNIESARGSEIVFNETPNSQVVNNYIKINDVIMGNFAVISTTKDTVIENNTPTSQKMEEMQQTIDELQKEIDELKAAKNTTLTLDEITDAKYNGNVTISGSLINDDSIGLYNQIITLTIGETEVNVTTKGGLFEYTTLFKEVGEKTVTAYYAGTDKYLESEASITFTVEKQDLLITFDPIADTAYGDNVTITGKFTQADGRAVSNSNVNIYINDKQFKARTDKTGTFTLTTTVKATGTNNVTLSYGGNDKYNKFETSTTFNADKQDLIITYDAIADVKYNDNVTITGKFTDANGKAISNSNVNVYINGKQYKARTDKTGAFTLSVQTKTIGTNNVTLSYGGNDKYNSFETSTTFNVGAQDIVITYDPIAETVCGDNVTITGKFTEINGKAISKSNVNVYINGKQYKAKTDSTGAFTLSVATKVVGTNNVTFSYGGNAYYSSYETSTTFNVIAKAE